MAGPSFAALAFGPDLPAQGAPVEVELRSRALVLHRADGREDEIAYSWIRPRAGGWRGDAVLLDWEADGRAFTLSVQSPPALAVLRREAPAALRSQLGGAARPGRALPVGLAIAGLATLGLLAVLAVALATQGERLVDLAVRRVPLAWEAQLGAASVAPLVRTGVLPADHEVSRVVTEIGTRLASESGSPYTYRWYVVDEPTVNALAAPGGHVVVFTGLVREAGSAEELAGVLAHEIEHVVLRHSLRGLVRQLGWRTIVGLAFGGAGDVGGAVGGVVEKLGGLRFSREQEREADVAGVQLLQRAGIDPLGMASFFERLAAAGREPPAFLSTHPESRDRSREIRALIASSPKPAPLPYDWESLRARLAPPAGVPAP